MDSGLHQPVKPTDCWSFCGPTALAVILGKDIHETNRAIADLRIGRRSSESTNPDRIKTTTFDELLAVLMRFGKRVKSESTYSTKRYTNWPQGKGYDTMYLRYNTSPTLASFVRERTEPGKVYLVRSGFHFVVVKNGRVWDTHGYNTPMTKCRHKRHRVTHFTVVE